MILNLYPVVMLILFSNPPYVMTIPYNDWMSCQKDIVETVEWAQKRPQKDVQQVRCALSADARVIMQNWIKSESSNPH